MKYQELDVTKEYYAIPSWATASKWKKDLKSVERRHLLKVSIESLVKVEYKVMKLTGDNPSQFVPTKDSKNYGVKVIDENGHYWIAKPSHIIAEVQYADKQWAVIHQAKQEAERIEAEKRERAQRLRDMQLTQAKLEATTTAKTLSELSGIKLDLDNLRFDYSNKGSHDEPKFEGMINLPTKVLQQIVERFYELQEN